MSPPCAQWYAGRLGRVSLAALACATAACAHPRAEDLESVTTAFEAAAPEIGWPGFDPLAIPLALYDDANTYLIRHPAPPKSFRRMRGTRGVWVADTLFAGMRANTDVELEGTRTAVVGLGGGRPDPVATAAVLMHEAFHAYQTQTRPEWTANEADVFDYPFRSARLLEMRRLESGALRRAVSAPDSVREMCWAREFLRVRRERFRGLPGTAVAYERASELREGLARYIERRVTGEEPAIPADGYLPEAVRERTYETGSAIAVLLDRMAPGWKTALMDAGETASLDGALDAAIGDVAVRDCRAGPDEAARTRGLARSDSADLVERDARALAEFERAPGWRVEIQSGEERLQAGRFDPLNIRLLGDRRVLHTRWITVSNGRVEAEVVDRTALTRGAPGHPLFAGLEYLSVTGLREPVVEARGDTISIAGDGLTVRAVGATLERDGQTIRIRGR